MRTAEERVSTALGWNLNISTLKLAFWYEIIREAQIEAIKECAEEADAWCYAEGNEPEYGVDKQSILKLIDQVK